MLRDAVLRQRTEGVRMRVSKPQKALCTGEWVEGGSHGPSPRESPESKGDP